MSASPPVDCRIGSLEIDARPSRKRGAVDCIGSLEILFQVSDTLVVVDCRIGSLETSLPGPRIDRKLTAV